MFCPFCTDCSKLVDVTLLLDLSESDKEFYDLLLKFMAQVLNDLPTDVDKARIGIITYADHTVLKVFSYTNIKEIKKALASRKHQGRTQPSANVEKDFESVFVKKLGERKHDSKIVIVLTDGYSDFKPESAVPEGLNLRGLGTKFYAVAIGTDINKKEMNQLAKTDIANHVIYVPDSESIASGVITLLSWICQ